MEQLLVQFLEHLRYERNVSEHTLRNYASDLNQFLDYLAPAHPQTQKRPAVDIATVDHITIREWLSTLHSAQKKKSSVARKLAALRTFFQLKINAVCKFQSAILPHFLYAVDKLADHTLFFELLGECHIKCNGKRTIGSDRPTRNIFGKNRYF